MTEDARACRRTRRDMLLFLDGDLPEKEAIRIRNHLSTCEACRAAMERIAPLWRTEVCRLEPSPYLWTRLRVRLDAGESIRTRWLRHWRGLRGAVVPAFRMAGVIAAVWLGTVVGNLPEIPPVGQEAARVLDRMFYLDAFDIAPPGSISRVYGESMAPSP